MQLDARSFLNAALRNSTTCLDEVGGGSLGKQAASFIGIGRSLGVKLSEGHEFRLSSTNQGIELDQSADGAKVILGTDIDTGKSWQILINDGFDFAERISLLAGQFHHLFAWKHLFKLSIITARSFQTKTYPMKNLTYLIMDLMESK